MGLEKKAAISSRSKLPHGGVPDAKEVQRRLDEFLTLYASGVTQEAACRQLKISGNLVSRHRVADPKFDAAFQDAWNAFTNVLERRAEQMAATCPYNAPTMLIFMLKARRPEVYRDNLNIKVTPGSEFAAPFINAMEKALALPSRSTQH